MWFYLSCLLWLMILHISSMHLFLYIYISIHFFPLCVVPSFITLIIKSIIQQFSLVHMPLVSKKLLFKASLLTPSMLSSLPEKNHSLWSALSPFDLITTSFCGTEYKFALISKLLNDTFRSPQSIILGHIVHFFPIEQALLLSTWFEQHGNM